MICAEGMMAVISVKMSEVEFVGQTKDQLGSASARSAVDFIVSENMARFLEENPQVAQSLLKKSIQASRAREAARKARDEIRSGKKRSESSNLGGKLACAVQGRYAYRAVYRRRRFRRRISQAGA